MLTRRHFLASPAALTAVPAPVNNLALWYKQPAKLWTEALPVGNGRLGAMVFGGIAEERIVLNESGLWSGSPQDADRPDAWTPSNVGGCHPGIGYAPGAASSRGMGY